MPLQYVRIWTKSSQTVKEAEFAFIPGQFVHVIWHSVTFYIGLIEICCLLSSSKPIFGSKHKDEYYN